MATSVVPSTRTGFVRTCFRVIAFLTYLHLTSKAHGKKNHAYTATERRSELAIVLPTYLFSGPMHWQGYYVVFDGCFAASRW